MSRGRSTKLPAGDDFGDGARHHAFEQGSLGYDENMNDLETEPGVFGSYGGGEMEFDMVERMFGDGMQNMGPADAYEPAMSMNHAAFSQSSMGIDPASMNQYAASSSSSLNTGSHGHPRSAQSDIVSRRKGVSQQFGQITPPDNVTPDSNTNLQADQQAQEDIAKLNRAQRARNAANKRHSSKRKDSSREEADEADVDEDGQKQSTSVQREKNRVAAAKCRAKKKATAEEMQDVHREGSRRHSFLVRELRELRDQKAFLRNTLLQHDPDICQCHAIHRFNMAQAHQMAMGVGGFMPAPPESPSMDSMGSAPTPSSESSTGVQFQSGGSSSRIQSIPESMAESFSQFDGPGSMQTQDFSTHAAIQMQQQFSEFLQNPPDERGRYR